MHICCGPCATLPSRLFNEREVLYDGYFYNPNIHPKSEFDERMRNAQILADKRGFKLIVDTEYNEEGWIEYKDMPSRCLGCYAIRFEGAFKYASKNHYKAVTTSLLISPYQQHDKVKELAEKASKKYNIPFYYEDFRDQYYDGQREAKEMGLYCQKYCGCISSFEDKLIEDIKKGLRKEVREKNG